MTSWTEAEFNAFLARGRMPEQARQAWRPSTVSRESYSRRGMELEQAVEAACQSYYLAGIADIRKIPTPAKIVYDKNHKPVIVQQASTVDFEGPWRAAGGVSVAFDAKETQELSWPLRDLQDHQRAFLSDHVIRGGGIAGILVRFVSYEKKTFWLPISLVQQFEARKVRGGRKSIALPEIPERYLVRWTERAGVDFLRTIEEVRENAR